MGYHGHGAEQAWIDDSAEADDAYDRQQQRVIDGEECPKCRSLDIGTRHHSGDALAPECDYWECEQCHHQWGHQ